MRLRRERFALLSRRAKKNRGRASLPTVKPRSLATKGVPTARRLLALFSPRFDSFLPITLRLRSMLLNGCFAREIDGKSMHGAGFARMMRTPAVPF